MWRENERRANVDDVKNKLKIIVQNLAYVNGNAYLCIVKLKTIKTMNEYTFQHILYLNNQVIGILVAKCSRMKNDTFIYNGVKYQMIDVLPHAYITNNIYVVPCIVKKMGKVRYKWVAECSDGSFNDESRESYKTKEECYCYMRDAALEKMKWNTEYQHDFDNEEDSIGYEVSFSQNEIKHTSYSGTYTYKIIEVIE